MKVLLLSIKTSFIYLKMILNLEKKESQLLNDVFTYMIDYINDDCFSDLDRKSFDSIYSKLKNLSN